MDHDDDPERWTDKTRPRYAPDWGEGQIHLDGEKDFPASMAGEDAAEALAERCREIPGTVRHDADACQFRVTSQMGALVYVCEYGEPGQPVERIRYSPDGGDRWYSYTVEELENMAQAVRAALTGPSHR